MQSENEQVAATSNPTPLSAATAQRRKTSRLFWLYVLIPVVITLAKIALGSRIPHLVQEVWDTATPFWYLPILVLLCIGMMRDNPARTRHLLHYWGVRLTLVGGAISLVGSICLLISALVSHQAGGIGQIVLVIVTISGIAIAGLLGPLVLLYEASDHVIKQYQSTHRHT